MPKKFYVSWDNLQREARRLARRQLPVSQWKGIIAVSRGGLVPAADANTALSDTQKELRRKLHQTIQKVSDDYGRRQQFNTVIAAIMELLNAADKTALTDESGRRLRQELLEAAVLMLFPIVPHIGEAGFSAVVGVRLRANDFGDHRQAADARTDHHARAHALFFGREVDARILDRLIRCTHRKMDEVVHLLLFFRLDIIVRIELTRIGAARHITRDFRRNVRHVHVGDGDQSGLTGNQLFPDMVNPHAEWRDET